MNYVNMAAGWICDMGLTLAPVYMPLSLCGNRTTRNMELLLRPLFCTFYGKWQNLF